MIRADEYSCAVLIILQGIFYIGSHFTSNFRPGRVLHRRPLPHLRGGHRKHRRFQVFDPGRGSLRSWAVDPGRA